MTSYLAAESPGPSSVISEYYFQQFNFLNKLPMINNEKKKCLFGEKYEQEFCFYLAKHAEINCDDRVCLIGEESGWTVTIQERLFLNKTVCFIDCNLQQDAINKQLSINKFDRIILFNCLHKINHTSISPINLLHSSLKIDGRLIIIYREPNSSTLPLPTELVTKWFNAHANSMRFIKQIYREQKNNIEIYQKIEIIKFFINKLNWFSLLYNRMFYPLTLINQKQILDGLRQLNETYFKYHRNIVEIHERLLFLTIQKTTDPLFHFPKSIQLSNNPTRQFVQKPLSTRMWHSQISITNEITQLLKLKEKNKK